MILKKNNPDHDDKTGHTDRGIIGLGDLMRALKKLNVQDQETIERIGHSLGFSGINTNPVGEAQGISAVRSQPKPIKKLPSNILSHQSVSPSFASPPELPDEILDIHMEQVKSQQTETMETLPAWLNDDFSQDPTYNTGTQSVPRASLFPKRLAKGLFTAAAATRRCSQTPDVQHLIRMLTHGHVFDEFPYLVRPSLHQGVQLLMDTSGAMMPFLEDLDDLAVMVQKVVGAHCCELYEFHGNPSQASRWSPDFREIKWRPARGRPILIVTDFGAGALPAAHDRSGMRDWLWFIKQVNTRSVPVIAFVPYGRKKWPKVLTRSIHFIHWDPRTRASHIKKRFGSGHEVNG